MSTAGPDRAPVRGSVQFGLLLGALAFALVASLVIATGIGPVGIAPDQVWTSLAHHLFGAGAPEESTDLITWQIRVPRVLLGAVVGASLAVAGMTVQAMVRNPIADPFVLGVSSGASVGAVAVIVLGWTMAGHYTVPTAAFVAAMASLFLVFAVTRATGRLSPIRLVLVGVALSYAFSGVTSFLLLSASGFNAQQQVLVFLLGSLAGAQWQLLAAPVIALVLGIVALAAQARQLNILVLGDEACAGLGVEPVSLRRRLVVVTAVMTGAVVAVSGGIGFVGLVVPHVARLIVGSDHRRTLLVSALLGALFLVWADVAARMLLRPAELPIGVLTAFVGVPFFLVLLRRRGGALETEP